MNLNFCYSVLYFLGFKQFYLYLYNMSLNFEILTCLYIQYYGNWFEIAFQAMKKKRNYENFVMERDEISK